MAAVFKRELNAYFHTAIGYFFLAIFLFIAGYGFITKCVATGTASMFMIINSLANVLYLLVPVLTMRVFSEELRAKTDQMLFTSPVPVGGIVMGKFFAAMLVLLISCVFSFVFPIAMYLFGQPYFGEIALAYFGFILLACALVSLGVFISTLTEHQFIASILTFFFILLFMAVDALSVPVRSPVFLELLSWFSLFSRFSYFASGIVSFDAVIYYLSFSLFFLLLATLSLKMRLLGTDKRSWFRLYAALLLIFAFISAVSVNSVAKFLVRRFDLRFDLTQNRLYELSSQSISILEASDQPVEIYTLFRTGAESRSVTNLLNRIESRAPRVRVENVDPVKNPVFTVQFDAGRMGIEENSLIVVNSERTRVSVIPPHDFYTLDEQGMVTGFVAEQKIIEAVAYADTGKQNRVLLLQGHGEASSSDLSDAVGILNASNYVVEDIALTLGGELNPRNDLLMIVEPLTDITKAEYEAIRAFLKEGGRLMISVSARGTVGANLDALLNQFNCTFSNDIIVEAESTNYIRERTNLIPRMGQTDVTSVLSGNKMAVIMPNARAIRPLFGIAPENVALTVLFATTDGSYSKKTDETSLAKSPDDETGPFAVGVAAVEKLMEEQFSFFIAYGSSDWLADKSFFSNPGNYNLLLTSVAWLYSGEKSSVTAAKPIGTNVLAINSDSQRRFLVITILGVIPIIILSAGFVTILRRRRA